MFNVRHSKVAARETVASVFFRLSGHASYPTPSGRVPFLMPRRRGHVSLQNRVGWHEGSLGEGRLTYLDVDDLIPDERLQENAHQPNQSVLK